MLPGAAGNPPRQIFLPARSVSQVNFKKKRHRWHSKETSWSNDLSVGVAGFLLGGGVNWLGTYNKWVRMIPVKTFAFPIARYGYGAEHILSMRAVLADGRIVEVTAEKTEVGKTSSSEGFLCKFPDSLPHTKHCRPQNICKIFVKIFAKYL